MTIAKVFKIISQTQPSSADTDTTSFTIGTDSDQGVRITSVVVCNTGSSYATWRIYASTTGSYATTNALFYDVGIEGNESIELTVNWPLGSDGGTLGVRSDTANAVTFTFFGEVG